MALSFTIGSCTSNKRCAVQVSLTPDQVHACIYKLAQDLKKPFVWVPDSREDSAVRQRTLRKMPVMSLSAPAQKQRQILLDEITTRMLDVQHPKFRLVMFVLSKDTDYTSVLSASEAKRAYTTYEAVLTEIWEEGMRGLRKSGRDAAASHKSAGQGQKANFLADSDDEGSSSMSTNVGGQSVVSAEIAAFKNLSSITINRFKGEGGLINNYDMFYELRDEFPLHSIAFQRAAPFIDTEANCERTFSAASGQSDPNMKASTLRKRIFIAKNKSWYRPTDEQIKERYMKKYRSLEEPQVQIILSFLLPECT